MLTTTREKRPASRTLRGWAIAVLQEAGAIKECEEHGWMQDCADPHAPPARLRHRAIGTTARSFAASGSGRHRRGAGFDRRQLPRMPAVLDGEHATSCFRTSRFSIFLRRCRLS